MLLSQEEDIADPPDLRENRDKDDADWRRYYTGVRRLPSGELAGLSTMTFTTALVVGLDDEGYRGRYCYELAADAEEALKGWDGNGDPSGPWIKFKGRGGDRLGPGTLAPARGR